MYKYYKDDRILSQYYSNMKAYVAAHPVTKDGILSFSRYGDW